MTRAKYFRVAILIAAALAASGCGVFKKGKAQARRCSDSGLRSSPAKATSRSIPTTAALPMTLPPAAANTDWTQSGGNPTKSMGQLALGNALTRVFSVQAGRGSSLTARLAAAPIVAGGRVYTIDTLGIGARLRRAHGRRSFGRARPRRKRQ